MEGTIKVDDRPEAHQWLRENGFGDLIKNSISAEFGMGEDNIAKDFYEAALSKVLMLIKKKERSTT